MCFVTIFVGMFRIFFITFISIIIALSKTALYASTISLSIIIKLMYVSVSIIAILYANAVLSNNNMGLLCALEDILDNTIWPYFNE